MNFQAIKSSSTLSRSRKTFLDLPETALFEWQTNSTKSRASRLPLTIMSKFLSLVCLTALAVPSLYAADQPPAKIDVSKLPAKIMEDVVVPVPSEVFAALDKMGESNWHGVLRSVSEKTPTPSERPEIALLMGSTIAEGFIAVQAQDSGEVKEIGREILKLAKALAIQEQVVKRTNAIIESADKKAWDRVRVEFDGALTDVRSAMTALKDDELSQLVSLGGWLRGTEAVTQVVSGNYSAERAELLHQPVLLDYFSERISSMGSRIQGNATVAKIGKRLPELKPLISVTGGVIEETSVKKINVITADMVKTVTSKES